MGPDRGCHFNSPLCMMPHKLGLTVAGYIFSSSSFDICYFAPLTVPLSPDCFLDDTRIKAATATPVDTDPVVGDVVASQEWQDLCYNDTTCLFFTWSSGSIANETERYQCYRYASAEVADFEEGVVFFVSGPRECDVTVPPQNETGLVDTRELSSLSEPCCHLLTSVCPEWPNSAGICSK